MINFEEEYVSNYNAVELTLFICPNIVEKIF